MEDATKRRITEFFEANVFGVISTVDSQTSKPESALVGVSHTDNLELIFGTSNQSRKYQNIQHNPSVSFVVGWEPAEGTVQFEGFATEIAKDDEDRYVAIHTAKNPASKKFAANPDQRYFIVRPNWIRLTDNRNALVEEVSF